MIKSEGCEACKAARLRGMVFWVRVLVRVRVRVRIRVRIIANFL